jgi:putative membrane protein
MFSFDAMEISPLLKRTLLQVLSTSLTLLVADYLMESVHFEKPWVALVTALILAILNTFLKPLLILLTIPATLITLGLFLLVINAAMLMIADQLVRDFTIDSFWTAFVLALLISLVNSMLGGNVRVERRRLEDDTD